MYYEPLNERLPELVEHETRTLIILNNPDIPEGEYGLIEAYCNDPDCDCRRVMLNVYDWKNRELLAVIAYGWEDYDYYVEWFGEDDSNVIRGLQGPILNSGSRQSRLAPFLLDVVKQTLQDQWYVGRLKRHYAIFKETIGSKSSVQAPVIVKPAARRNEPCPCGSGKKYKHCCRKSGKRR